MTVRGRLFTDGLLDAFDDAASQRDRKCMIELLCRVELPVDQAMPLVNALLDDEKSVTPSFNQVCWYDPEGEGPPAFGTATMPRKHHGGMHEERDKRSDRLKKLWLPACCSIAAIQFLIYISVLLVMEFKRSAGVTGIFLNIRSLAGMIAACALFCGVNTLFVVAIPSGIALNLIADRRRRCLIDETLALVVIFVVLAFGYYCLVRVWEPEGIISRLRGYYGYY